MANIFLSMLEADRPLDELQKFVHPYVIRDWGDFKEAKEAIKTLKDVGLSTKVRYNNRRDMAYVYMFENITDGILIQDYQIIPNTTVITFVKNERNNEWRIYSIGKKLDDYIVTVEPVKAIKKGLEDIATKILEFDLFKRRGE